MKQVFKLFQMIIHFFSKVVFISHSALKRFVSAYALKGLGSLVPTLKVSSITLHENFLC